MCKKDVLAYLVDYITTSLDETLYERNMGDDSEFLLGKTYALIECFEIIMRDEGVDYDTMIELEKHYGIR